VLEATADSRLSTYQQVSDFTDGVTAHKAITVDGWAVHMPSAAGNVSYSLVGRRLLEGHSL